jgi:hypothetical protein
MVSGDSLLSTFSITAHIMDTMLLDLETVETQMRWELELTFSYIFGDGNPNEDLEKRRLSLAAKAIRVNNGAVSAEQLAPFCNDAPSSEMGKERVYVDEVSAVVIKRGNGP